MRRYVRDTMLLAGLIALPFSNTQPHLAAQDHWRASSLESRLSDVELERYSMVKHTFEMGESLSDVDGIQTENIDKLEWLIDTYNRPLEQGDSLTLIETESQEGISYPYAFEVDFADSEIDDILLVGRKRDLGYAIRVDYHDADGLHRRSLWTNKRNPSLFDIAQYEVRFPLEGHFEDHQRRISSPYGPRNNPVRGVFGGPESSFHRGIDIPLDVGTPIVAPLEGSMMAGYVAQETGERGYDTFMNLGKVSEIRSRRVIRNDHRRQQVQNITFQFFHLSDYPEQIKDDFAELRLSRANIPEHREQEFREWYKWVLTEQDESRIYRNLRQHGRNSYFFRGLDVEKGERIAYSGNTGLSSGPHIHIGVIVNGRFVDPEEFFERYGTRQGLTEREAREDMSRYRALERRLR